MCMTALKKIPTRFLQDSECYFRAGKVNVLLKLTKGYVAENRRVRIRLHKATESDKLPDQATLIGKFARGRSRVAFAQPLYSHRCVSQFYPSHPPPLTFFSQFTQVLDILQAILKHGKIKYLLLTGSTTVDVRQSLVDKFSEEDSITAFLLATKVEGMGISLPRGYMTSIYNVHIFSSTLHLSLS